MKERSSYMIRSVIPQEIYFQPGRKMPNHPTLPVLIYREVIERRAGSKAQSFTRIFQQHNWIGIWKSDIYDYDHFHSHSHEALGIAEGQAKLQLGGENGKEIDVEAGDLLILPAGTGHRKISGSENLVVIGAYPPGQENYDICRSLHDCPGTLERITSTPLPETDPFYGADGPLIQSWK